MAKKMGIIVIDNVDERQYEWVRQVLIKTGMTPVIKHVDSAEFKRKIGQAWHNLDMLQDHMDMHGRNEAMTNNEQKFTAEAEAEQQMYLNGVIDQLDGVYAIVFPMDHTPVARTTFFPLTQHLQTLNPELKQFVAQPDGRAQIARDLTLDLV